MRILFMGTPDFAAVSLKRLVEDGHELCGVFTQPDKPRNRNKVTFSPVKEYALSHGLTVYQPTKLRDGTALELVRSLAPELIVVVAYGRILPKDILDVPPLGCVNVHASLLPKYRGSAPINWAMLNGDTETGVSIMYMAEELDAGDVILTAKTPIDPEEDQPSLWDRLAKVGAEALAEALPLLAAGTAPRTPQDAAQATFAPMLSRELSPIDWTKPVAAIRNQVRGLIPGPAPRRNWRASGSKFTKQPWARLRTRRPVRCFPPERRASRWPAATGRVFGSRSFRRRAANA